MRVYALALLLFLAFPLDTAAQAAKDTDAYEAFSMAVNQHAATHRFKQGCGWGLLRSTIVLVPLNRDVVKTAVAYKAEKQGLSASEQERLRRQAIREHVDGEWATFVLIVRNDYSSRKESVELINPKRHTKLFTETREYALEKYTRLFGTRLPNGETKGYLYFENFRPSSSNSYSLHFNAIQLECGGDLDGSVRQTTFAFDHSEVGFLAMMDEGTVGPDPPPAGSPQPSASDVLNVASILFSILSMI